MPERIYGWHAVRALLQRTPQRVHRVWLQRERHDARATDVEQLATRNRCQIERVAADKMRMLVGDVSHQGVAAEIETLPPWREDDLLAALSSLDAPLVLALDGVQDPHNLGACLRTADACGVLAVVVPKDRAAQLNAAARKVAAGAAETTPVVAVTNLARTLQLLKGAGLWIVGAEADAPQLAHAVDLTGPRCLVLGAEGSGLRALTLKQCDWRVRLPSLGAVESLNVSVAAGMLLYEAIRQRQAVAGA
jgi:23S rRNA (guanosine2251-2'-O)-methyltransferase